MKTIILFPIISVFSCFELRAGDLRTWNDRGAKYSTEAELVSIAGINVVLRKTDGKSVTVPIDKLSDADQTYIKSLSTNRKPSNALQEDGALAKNSQTVEPKTVEDLKKLLENQREAYVSLEILKSFIASADIAADQRALAQAELPRWTELAGQNSVRVGNKWVTRLQFQQMKDDEIRLIKEAHRLIDIKSDKLAKERFLDASQANPQGVRADFYLGLLNGLVAKYPSGAEKHFQECIRRMMKDGDLLTGTRKANYIAALNNFAVTEVRLRKYDSAISAWRKALEIAPFVPELVQNLGRLVELGTNSDAFRISRIQRESAGDLYAKTTVQNNLARFDKKVGWLLMPYIDSLDGTIDEKGDEEFVNVGWCTGFCVGTGFVLTSRYPLLDCDKVVVREGGNIFEVPSGKIVAISEKSNLALLKIDLLPGKPLEFSSVKPKPAQEVVINGYREPGFGADPREHRTATIVDIPNVLRHVRTAGFKTERSVVFASFSARDMIQHDAILTAGMEGAPIINKSSQVIGVHLGNPPNFGTFNSKFSLAEPASYAAAFLKPILSDLIVKDANESEKTQSDSPVQQRQLANSVYQLAIQKRAPRLAWSHRIEELHRLQRQGGWTSYEDNTCMRCNGQLKIDCPGRGCTRGAVRHKEPELKHKDANTGTEVWGTRVVTEKCSVCGGSGTIACPLCRGSGIDHSLN